MFMLSAIVLLALASWYGGFLPQPWLAILAGAKFELWFT
jgi:hypothetical protein